MTAAFGFYPQINKKRTKQDPEAAKNVPLSVARGWLAGGLGLPGDIEGLARMGINAVGGKVDPTPAMPTGDFFNEWLPGRAEGAANRAGEGLGNLFGGAGTAAAAGVGTKAFAKAAAKNIDMPSKGAPGGKFKQRGAIEVVPKALQGLKLKGLPDKVVVDGTEEIYTGFRPAQEAAEKLARDRGIDYVRPDTFANVDPVRAKRIAKAFEDMKHNPQDPVTRAAYQALIEETMAQYAAARRAGLKVDFMPESGDPYGNPRNALKDIYQNNHMFVFPTDAGFGGSLANKVEDNPLLALTDEKISGKPARVNDIFRVVHDYFGHAKEGVGFRAAGEENAWQQHASMFPELSKRAMTTETRGQNSWVNFGPHAEFNKKASPSNTEYAEQKIGLLPEWASSEGQVAATPTSIVRKQPSGKAVVKDMTQKTQKTLGYDPAEVAMRYPLTGAPTLKVDKKKGKEFLSKELTPEALAVQKARNAAQKEIDAGNYEPFFKVEDRYYADPANYPLAERTLDVARPKKQATADKWVKEFDTPEARERLQAGYEAGNKDPFAKDWYAMGQLEDRFVREYGPEQGRKMFKERFADAMAATTGGANPKDNLMMAHYGNFMRQKGQPLPTNSYDLPFPVGGRYGGNLQMYDRIINKGEGLSAYKQPKRHNFAGNFMGHRDRGTIDEQMMSGVSPGGPASPPGDSYSAIENMTHELAAKNGVMPANFQDVAWAGLKGTKGKPMIQQINEAIERTRRITGLSPEEIVRRGLVRAEMPLYGGGGLLVGGVDPQGLFED